MQIIRPIDIYTREVWNFIQFDLNFVLNGYHVEVKPKGKRKWTIDLLRKWDNYSTRDSSIDSPTSIPSDVMVKLQLEIFERTKIITWKAWKNK